MNLSGKTCLVKTALSLLVALGAVIVTAQEVRISEECYIPSCPGHIVPTNRDSATKVKLTPNQCKVEKVCQSVLTAIREMAVSPTSCNSDAVQFVQSQIDEVEKQVMALHAKTKINVLNADGRPTMAQVLEIELANKLSQCEAEGLFPRWEKTCTTSNCESALSYIGGLGVDADTCPSNDGGGQGLILKSEQFVADQKLQEYLNKCRTANLIPLKVVKGEDIYYSDLIERRNEFTKKFEDLIEPFSAGFGKSKVTIPAESFDQLMARVDSLEVNPEQCNSKYEKVLKKAVDSYRKLFKKYPEFSQAEEPQVVRAEERIEFHIKDCKRIGLR